MATRYGNNYVVGIQADSAFNVDPADLTTGWTLVPDVMEITSETPQSIELPAKDQYIVPYDHTVVAGLKKPVVKLSGTLTDTHEILLKALTGTGSSPYTITNQNTVNSYTIIQQFATAEVNVVTGCVLESMTIRGGAGEPISYEATFRGGTVDRENTSTYDTLSVPDLKPFLFQNCGSPSLAAGNITNCNSFDLSLTRVFPDDKFMFQNSDVWTAAYQCRITGEFKANYIYDTSNDANVFDNLLNGTTYSDSVELRDASGGTYEKWAIGTYGQYTDYSMPDPDRCIYEGGFTKTLMWNGTNQPLTATLSSVSE